MTAGFVISIILNLLAFLLTVVGTVVMVKGIDADKYLAGNGWGSLKFFTVQSNLIYGAYAGIFAVCELVCGSADKVPQIMYLLKYIFTVGVTITMLTVLLYLAPVVEKSYPALFKGANLYFHLLVPLLGVISFCFLEKAGELSIPQTFLGLIPFAAYGAWYTVNVLTHAEDGKASRDYDWYSFVAEGIDKAAIAVIVMSVAATAVCFGLRFLHIL